MHLLIPSARLRQVALLAGALGAMALARMPARAATTPNPEADRLAFRAYFKQRFPAVKNGDWGNGPYAVNAGMRQQWEAIMQFPPYDFALGDGEKEFHRRFADGKTYADCFPDKGIGIRQNYPYFDTKTGKVITLGIAINRCRVANGEKPLNYQKGLMASIEAYMAHTSRGKPFDIKIPNDPRALAAYEDGRKFFYSRRGQLNFSCASCHVQAAGQRLRGDILAPALGILAAFPIYRSDWGSMGTIQRRFTSCNVQVRSVPFKPQDKTYRDLEYFLSYMSNGVPITGPGARP